MAGISTRMACCPSAAAYRAADSGCGGAAAGWPGVVVLCLLALRAQAPCRVVQHGAGPCRYALPAAGASGGGRAARPVRPHLPVRRLGWVVRRLASAGAARPAGQRRPPASEGAVLRCCSIRAREVAATCPPALSHSLRPIAGLGPAGATRLGRTRSLCGATSRTASAPRCTSWSGGRRATWTRRAPLWRSLPGLLVWLSCTQACHPGGAHCVLLPAKLARPLPPRRSPEGGGSTRRSGTGTRRGRCRRASQERRRRSSQRAPLVLGQSVGLCRPLPPPAAALPLTNASLQPAG